MLRSPSGTQDTMRVERGHLVADKVANVKLLWHLGLIFVDTFVGHWVFSPNSIKQVTTTRRPQLLCRMRISGWQFPLLCLPVEWCGWLGQAFQTIGVPGLSLSSRSSLVDPLPTRDAEQIAPESSLVLVPTQGPEYPVIHLDHPW